MALQCDVEYYTEMEPYLWVLFTRHVEMVQKWNDNSIYFTFIDYVADIYNTLMTTPREELKALENELKQEVPAPLHSMLEKENKDEAILKHQARKQKETVICPPTCTGIMP